VINRNDPSRAPADGEESHEQPQDFDDSANELWSLYEKEAKSHDESRIETLKDDMDGVLIYVCEYFSG
jgi:predicted neuraminidase